MKQTRSQKKVNPNLLFAAFVLPVNKVTIKMLIAESVVMNTRWPPMVNKPKSQTCNVSQIFHKYVFFFLLGGLFLLPPLG